MTRQNGTQRVYRVEVRVGEHMEPVKIGDRLIGHKWRELPTIETFPYGTAHRSDLEKLARAHNYHGAIALAASVLSADRFGTRLEVRIVGLKLTYELELERVEELAVPTAFDVMFDMARKSEDQDAHNQE